MTHKNGPIMMKWSIWVILERLQTFLLTSSSFLDSLLRFLTIQLPICNTDILRQVGCCERDPFARMDAVSVSVNGVRT